MNANAPRRGDDAWFNKSSMARIFDCSPQAFDQFVRPHVPPGAVRKVGREIYFWARRVIEAWAARSAEDPLLAGSDSPALELYRAEKAKIARLQRLALEGELVALNELHHLLTLLGTQLRKAGESMRDLATGAQAAEALNEALSNFDALVSQLQKEKSNDDADPSRNGRAV